MFYDGRLAMPSLRRDDVRHATLFLRQECYRANSRRGEGTFKMFRIRGANRQNREYHVDLVHKVANDDWGAAIILAAVYFEWCVRRCIIALASAPVADIRKKVNDRRMSFDKLQKTWAKEVCGQRPDVPALADVFDSIKGKPHFGNLVLEWRSIDYARQLRNRLVHGERCDPLERNGRKYVELLLAASDVIVQLSESRGQSIFKPIKRNNLKTKPASGK